jgi:hypothetical protein
VHGDIHVLQEVLGFVPAIWAPDGSPILALISTSLPSSSTGSLNASPIRLATDRRALIRNVFEQDSELVAVEERDGDLRSRGTFESFARP